MHKKQQELVQTIKAFRHTSEELHNEADKREEKMLEALDDDDFKGIDADAYQEIEKIRSKAYDLEDTIYRTLADELFNQLKTHAQTAIEPNTHQFLYDVLAKWDELGLFKTLTEQNVVVKYALEGAK